MSQSALAAMHSARRAHASAPRPKQSWPLRKTLPPPVWIAPNGELVSPLCVTITEYIREAK